MWIKLHSINGVPECFNTDHIVRVFTDSAVNKGTQIATADGRVISVGETMEEVLRHIVAG